MPSSTAEYLADEHAVQLGAPCADTKPGPHRTQRVAPYDGCDHPAGQLVHAVDALAAEYDPGSHSWQSLLEMRPCARPGVHAEQTALPARPAAVPGLHSAQAERPDRPAALPTGHSEHAVDAEIGEY